MPVWLRGILFVLTVVAVWSGVHVYLYSKFAVIFQPDKAAKRWAIFALVFLAASYFLARGVDSFFGRDVALPLHWIGAVWLGYVGVAFSVFFLYDILLNLPLWIAAKVGSGPVWAEKAKYWGIRAAMLAGILVTVFGLVRNFSGPVIKTYEIALDRLPKSLDGFVLVQGSDIHLGGLVGDWYVSRIERAFEKADGDLVVLTGDLCDEHNGGDGALLGRLGKLRSKKPILAVAGNHERYSGGEPLVQKIKDSGIDVLRQTHRIIDDGLVIAGIDDSVFMPNGLGDVPAAIDESLKGAPAELPVILLSHRPSLMEHAAKAGVDLMLTGHTHGGQTPPFGILNRFAFPVIKGFANYDQMKLYVTTGTAWWGAPVRVFNSPEIVRFVLRSSL